MNRSCFLLEGWKGEEIISLPENISANLTEEFLMSSSLCTTLKLLTVLNYVVQILGVICNIISSAVLFGIPRKNSAFDNGLIFLAGFDTVFLFSSSTKLLLGKFIGLRAKNLAAFVVLQCISWTASLWATFGVSVERFITVFFVFRAKSLCTHKRTILAGVIILLFAVVFNIPLFVLLQNIQWDEDLMKTYMYLYHKYGKPVASHIFPWSFIKQSLFEIYYVYVNTFLMYCLPLVGTAILSTSTCIAMRKVDRIRREMTQNKKIKRYRCEVFKGLVTVYLVAYFAVLSFTVSYYNVVSFAYSRVAESLCCFLISVNSSAKIIIYMSVWKDFRDTLRRMRQKSCIRSVINGD